jgi:hypothetical protein
VAESWRQFENSEEGKRPPLEAVTKEMVKRQLTEKTYVRAVVNCSLCRPTNCWCCL